MREIVSVFGMPDKPIDIKIPKDLVRRHFFRIIQPLMRLQNISTMSRYNAEFPFSVAFPPQAMTNVLAEWLGKEGVTQAHIAGEYPNSRSNSETNSPFRNGEVRACYLLFQRWCGEAIPA